jgi:signal transduction histidine kinase
MRARLRQFGGELDIKTNMRGTTLFAVVPLTEQPEVNNKPLEQTAFRAPHSRAQPATLDT